MTLHETILAAKLDEVARAKRNHPIANSKFANYEEMKTQFEANGFGNMVILAHGEASLLAMQELAEFYEWLSSEGWLHEKENIFRNPSLWYKPHDDIYRTTEELYQTWKGEQK